MFVKPAEYFCHHEEIRGEISTVGGCGLTLCGSCATDYYSGYPEDLSALIAAREDSEGKDIRSRADANLLSV